MNRLLTADLHGTSEKRYDRLIFLRFFLRYIIILIVILSTIVPLFIRILRDQKAASIDEYERRIESVGRTITELLEAVEKRTIDIAWAYDVFLGDIDLSREIAARIAEFCNVTGSRQLSFDGLEGNMATGMGELRITGPARRLQAVL